MRLDQYLVKHQYLKSRSQATDYIKRGLISINDKVVLKPNHQIKDDDLIKINQKIEFVSRAGEKLYYALETFNISLKDKIVIDVGSSTGGFTDCSLKMGAKLVYAYDVGSNQMEKNLRLNPNIKLFEQTNFLHVEIPDANVCLIDVSFTSILPILKHLQSFNQEIIALIKPQFEVGKQKFRGVVKNKKLLKHTLTHVLNEIHQLGFHMININKAHIKGKKGNQEYVLYINNQMKSNDKIMEKIGDMLC